MAGGSEGGGEANGDAGGDADGPVQNFYEYRDDHGVQHFTSRLDDVPPHARAHAKHIRLEHDEHPIAELKARAAHELDAVELTARKGIREARTAEREVSGVLPFVADLDPPSIGVGFALGIGVFLVHALLRRSGRLVLKISLVAAMIVLLGGAYLGWLRRAAGLSDRAMASPGEIIDDARHGVDQLNERTRQQDRTLKSLEERAR